MFIHWTGCVRRVVDRVRVAHPCRCAGRSLQGRRPPVDRELCFAVEDDEHLLAVVVEVLADAGLRLDHAAMQKPQVRVDHVAVEQGEETELAGAAVDARGRPVARRIGVRDPLGQRQAGGFAAGLGVGAGAPAPACCATMAATDAARKNRTIARRFFMTCSLSVTAAPSFCAAVDNSTGTASTQQQNR